MDLRQRTGGRPVGRSGDQGKPTVIPSEARNLAEGWPEPPTARPPVRLGVLYEPLEPRVLSQRLEVGVDAKPAGREEVGGPQQRLELVERLVRLAGHDVDPGELVLDVGTQIAIA